MILKATLPHRKKKSKKPLVICLIILLIAAAAGGTAWYMMQRHKPVEATEKFLTGMQNMDFTTMENLLQSHDLSALDDADIRDSAYTDFFTTVNKKNDLQDHQKTNLTSRTELPG